MNQTDTYETKGWRRVFQELWGFTKNSLGNFFSPEFLSVLIPILLLWEFLPRWKVLPESLLPPLSVVARRFWYIILMTLN